MKTILLCTWIFIGCAGYYGYGFYQKSQTESQKQAQALIDATAANSEAKVENASLNERVQKLTGEVFTLQGLLENEKKKNASSEQPATVMPPTQVIPTSIPSTITTLYGATYTGCILSRVMPDGISFMHSTGVAKVLFSDLDPTFAATFGYDPKTAQKYEHEEAAKAAASDAQRAAIDAQMAVNKAVASSPQIVPDQTPSSPASATQTSSLSDAQKASIQAQIKELRDDIDFMMGQERISPGNYTHGGYPDKIDDDKSKIIQLQSQLH